ncbi:MAG TPA: aminotransferase class V-fold PLP-dependent enzyme [Bryobacteraceae bacterium]|nr:aminotransferase class V-fold PLP-dependent enzyme [Bryobacteraceae bacterium]
MPPEEFRKIAHEVVDWMADYLASVERYPVLPRIKPGELVDALPPCGPEHGEAMSAILDDFRRQIVPAATHWNHPGFMAYFAISASGPGILGEMLSATLNMNGMLWKTSPAVVELEQVTLDWLRRWMGLAGPQFGIIFDTASTSSMHAIAAAREMVAPEVRSDGGGAGLVVYTSEQAHSSIEKGAIAIGIGQKNVRKIPVDAEYRMRPDELSAAIEHDRAAGLRPFCVAATVGTTSTTSIDPVEAIAPIAERHGLWLHVDAAYAGVAAIAPEFQYILRGCDRADSLVVNPHKWLFTPVDLSVLYTRRPEILRRAFSLVPEYLRTAEDTRAVNFMDYGVPLGHRFRSLKLWFVLRYYGREGIAQMIRNHIGWAQELARQVDEDDRFERTAPALFSTVCFRLKGTDEENQALLERVNATGEVFLSHTVLHGRHTMRLAIGNIGTTRAHVQRAWELVKANVG